MPIGALTCLIETARQAPTATRRHNATIQAPDILDPVAQAGGMERDELKAI